MPFSEADRYRDWLVTVPSSLMKILSGMNLDPVVVSRKSLTLSVVYAPMIVSEDYGELVVFDDLKPR